MGAAMQIDSVFVYNYRCLKQRHIPLNPQLNIIVGDNECGKSTFLEAVNLALSGQLNGRPLQAELHPHLFNAEVVKEFIDSLRGGVAQPPPSILIEVYFADNSALARLKGTNNTRRINCAGVKLSIEFNEDYGPEYRAYIADPAKIRGIPVEYYAVRWRDFADNEVTARSIPLKPSLIDASAIRNTLAANRYVLEVVKESLGKREQVELALSYRIMKDKFSDDPKVREINDSLAAKRGVLSDKTLSVSLDTSSRAGWEASVLPHLDDVPMSLVGKGEQNSVKIKLAMESSADSHLLLIEEAENHLSHSNLNVLIRHIAAKRGDRQIILTTHSSFVLNKLGVESVLLFTRSSVTTLNKLKSDTKNYFIKLPGHETLRLILARRAILVEGPSDELIVQKAFQRRHGSMPLEAGVDVITVNSLAFKRFLEIAKLLDVRVDVVTDNDKNVTKLRAKYKDYEGSALVKINYDADEAYPTLEPQLLKANGRDLVNKILGTSFSTDDDLLEHMKDNKTEVALKFFETDVAWETPDYIERAIS